MENYGSSCIKNGYFYSKNKNVKNHEKISTEKENFYGNYLRKCP